MLSSKKSLFAVFGADGAPFVAGIVNSILGTLIVLFLFFGVVKIIIDLTQLKLVEDEDKRVIAKQRIRRTTIGFFIGVIAPSAMILILNMVPSVSGDLSQSSWFDALGGSKGEAQKLFNWILAVLTAISIVIFLITTPWKIFQWMIADEDSKKEKWKGIPRNIAIMISILVISLIVGVVVNVIPPISKI